MGRRLRDLVEDLVHEGVPLQPAREQFERHFLVAALRAHDGNVSRAATAVGVHRNTLRNKIESLRICPDDYAAETADRA